MSIKFIMSKITRVYSKNCRARIARSDGLPLTDPSECAATSATLAQGHEHWALQALAEEMAARHNSIRQAEMPRPEPAGDPAPPSQYSET